MPAVRGARVRADARPRLEPGRGRGSDHLRKGARLSRHIAPRLYRRQALAGDAGVSPEGSGFSAETFHHIVGSSEEVDAVIAKAVAAGGALVRAPNSAQWGGYFGWFADPDGHLWKVATQS